VDRAKEKRQIGKQELRGLHDPPTEERYDVVEDIQPRKEDHAAQDERGNPIGGKRLKGMP